MCHFELLVITSQHEMDHAVAHEIGPSLEMAEYYTVTTSNRYFKVFILNGIEFTFNLSNYNNL